MDTNETLDNLPNDDAQALMSPLNAYLPSGYLAYTGLAAVRAALNAAYRIGQLHERAKHTAFDGFNEDVTLF